MQVCRASACPSCPPGPTLLAHHVTTSIAASLQALSTKQARIAAGRRMAVRAQPARGSVVAAVARRPAVSDDRHSLHFLYNNNNQCIRFDGQKRDDNV